MTFVRTYWIVEKPRLANETRLALNDAQRPNVQQVRQLTQV